MQVPVCLGLSVCLLGALTAAIAADEAASPTRVAERATVSGYVGAHRLEYRVRVVPGEATFRVRPDRPEYIAVTEVHPGSVEPIPYHYLVTGEGIEPFERMYAARGFGPVTYFLRVAGASARIVHVRNLSGPDSPPRFLSFRGVTRAELDKEQARDRFTLMGTVVDAQLGMSEDEQAAAIADRLPTAPGRQIDRAFACEIYYAALDEPAVRAQLETARGRARKHGLRVLLGFVSWWAGTPLHVPDGLGGTFGDLKYQQVCYTPASEHPEDAGLRELLGPLYNSHFRLSVPNIWSNTPWLTMNSRTLNDYRAMRLREAARLLREVSSGDVSWIAGVFLENEPRYWDTQCTQGTPQWCGEQWADFNPMAVERAAQEGVTLDPTDGMSLPELEWLDMNVGRYFQRTVDVANSALGAEGLIGRFPLYTHSLQVAVLFPGCLLNRSPADWARAAGAATGIEGIWSNLSDYDRVREWGPWVNLNREETDGLPIDTHLWDLRVTYAAGADGFNSYNWHALKDDAYFRYADALLKGLPVVELPPATATRTAPDAMAIEPPMALQACDSLTVAVEAAGEGRNRAVRVGLAVEGAAGRTWFSVRRELQGPGPQEVTFVFPAPAELSLSAKSTIRLHAYDADGGVVPGGAVFGAGAEAALRLRLDLDECRVLSRLTMGWKHAAAQ